MRQENLYSEYFQVNTIYIFGSSAHQESHRSFFAIKTHTTRSKGEIAEAFFVKFLGCYRSIKEQIASHSNINFCIILPLQLTRIYIKKKKMLTHRLEKIISFDIACCWFSLARGRSADGRFFKSYRVLVQNGLYCVLCVLLILFME